MNENALDCLWLGPGVCGHPEKTCCDCAYHLKTPAQVTNLDPCAACDMQLPRNTHIKIKPLHPRFAELDLMPRRMTVGAVGYDLGAAIDYEIPLYSGGRLVFPCGFAIAIPAGFEGQVRPRSGLAAKRGVTVLNAPGTIDSDYRGEVKVILVNHGASPVTIRPGERIAQLVIARVESTVTVVVDELLETERGAGGFGSSGR